MRLVHMVLIATSAVALYGCFPMMESYYKLDRDGAKYFGGSCSGSIGPPSGAYFPHEGIFLSASVNETPRTILLGVHVPAGRTVQLLGRSVVISYGTAEIAVPLRTSPQRGGTPEPRPFREIPDPYGKEDFFGVLVGDTKPVRSSLFGTDAAAYKTYRFRADFEPEKATSGWVALPEMVIDGKPVRGPRLPFKKESHFEIAAINC